MKKISFLQILALFCFVFISCASKPRFKGSGDFCGMVVDENNQPVCEYLINCWRDGINFGSTLTNQSGIFVLQNIPSGKYIIEGQKENYSDIKNLKVDFCFRNKFLCCSVFSADGLFEKIKSLVKTEDYEAALSQLDTLRFKKDSYVEKICFCCQAWICVLKKDSKRTFAIMKKLRKSRDPELCKFADEMEVILNGRNKEDFS